ncbi:MAG: hypothetical protein ACR2N9_08305 [Acidimicrobiia bacterium]
MLGISLPFVLPIGVLILDPDDSWRPTISDYVDTVMGGVFVGILFAIGVFMYFYLGYESDTDNPRFFPSDKIASNLAGMFAIGVALFPTTSSVGLVQGVHHDGLERLASVGITTVEELADAIQGSPASVASVLSADEDDVLRLGEQARALLSPEMRDAMADAPRKYATGAYPPHPDHPPVDEPTSIRDDVDGGKPPARAKHRPRPD